MNDNTRGAHGPRLPMHEPITPLTLGRPRFTDPAIAKLAAVNGNAAAWSATLAAGKAEALRGVQGDFAVAWPLSDGRALLAADRFAVRSLCWRIVDGQLHVAERADDLARIEPAAAIDPQSIFDYLFFHVIPSPRTIFAGVYRIPAGHAGIFAGGAMTVNPWWVPDFNESPAGDFEPLAAEFRQLLEGAVKRQLSDGKAACFLSGGTDSSTVAGMIGRATGSPPATYSIGFEAEGYDEMEFARIAARRFGAEHHEYYVTPADLVQSMADVAGHYDQPFGNSSVLPAFYCAKMAREDGVTRLLAGDGGDELFGGNSRYAKQRIFGWYDQVPGALRSSLVEPLVGIKALHALPPVRKASSYVEQARVPMPDRLQLYNLLTRLGVDAVFTPGFLASVDRQAPVQHQRKVWAEPRTHEWLNRTLAFDWRYTLAEADLPKVCGSTRLAGVDVAFPFLDDRLLDFSMRLPVDYKLKGLKLRWFFKEALRGFLPDEIITKKKQGFGLPFGVWATRNDALHRLAADALGSLATRSVVRADFIKTLLSEHLPAHPGYYGEMVWILTMLELWLQGHAPNHRVAT